MREEVRALVALSAAIGSGGDVPAALVAARAACTRVAIEESILQAHLFVGYPKTLQAMAAWRELSGEFPAAVRGPERDSWRQRGEEICARVYGGQYQRLRSNVSRLHPELEQWMLEDGYGKVLGRPELDLVTRELCIVALLAVQDAPAQLHSHLRGALNAGAEEAAVAQALAVAAGYAPQQAACAADVWRKVGARRTPQERQVE